MASNRGRRYDNTGKLNIKKVIATLLALIVFVMIIVSIVRLLSKEAPPKEVSTLQSYFSSYENGKWGVIGNTGETVINPEFTDMIIIPNKLVPLFICTYDDNYDSESYKTKILDDTGTEILFTYDNVMPIENTTTDGRVVYDENALIVIKDGKYGISNLNGKELIPPTYDNIYALAGVDRSLVVESGDKKGLVNSYTGEVIVPVEYQTIEPISKSYEDGYIVKNAEGKVGLIALDKSTILEVKYDDIKKVVGKDYYVVVESGKTEIVDKKGTVVLDKGFDSVEEVGVDSFVVINKNKYAVINTQGESLIKDYDDIKLSQPGYYIVKKDGKYGVIDNDSNNIVEFKYEKISYISEGNFYSCDDETFKTDIYDNGFNLVLDDVIISELNIDGGYLRARVGDDYKYYNFKFEEKSNKDVLPTNTLFLVKENGKYGYENKDGQRIVDCIYDDAKEQNEYGFCAVNKDGLWGVLKSDGTVLVKPSRDLKDYLVIDFIGEYNRYNDLSMNVYTK